VTRGNSDLRVEKAWSFDVGSTYEHPYRSWGSFWIDASAFRRLATDLVAFRRSSLGYVRPYNVAQSRFFGAELSTEVDAWSHVRSRSGLSLLDPRDASEGRTVENDLIPFRSQLTFSQELEIYTTDLGEAVDHLGTIAYLTYRSGRVADPAGLIVIPQQIVVDVAARVRLYEALDLRVRGENLLQSARFDALGFPLPGRSVFVSVEATMR
jgi:iron complex outermembrane receptor protein